jgi:SAM-dependent methyltransferase
VHLTAGLVSRGVTGSRYVHPRSLGDQGEPDYSLDLTVDASSNYAQWIADLCAPHLGPTVLDVGAGYGAITSHVTTGREVTTLDTSPTCVDALRARFAETPNVRVVYGDLSALGDQDRFHSILLTNVLEHIRDDCGFLAALKDRLLPGGQIVVYVPAINGLFTTWDRKVGHYRRYSKRRLVAVNAEAGLLVTRLRYVNLLAIPAWPFSGRMGGHDRSVTRSLGAWDQIAVPVCRFIESRINPPVGLNLLCVSH